MTDLTYAEKSVKLDRLVQLIRGVVDHRPTRNNADRVYTRTLWDQPPSQPVATSQRAAAQVAPVASKLRQRVYDAIAANPGCTDEEIANRTGMNPSSARPRRIELARAGKIRPCLVLGTNASGRKAVRWEVT